MLSLPAKILFNILALPSLDRQPQRRPCGQESQYHKSVVVALLGLLNTTELQGVDSDNSSWTELIPSDTTHGPDFCLVIILS